MSSITSPALAAFRHEYFGAIDQYLAWHDGFRADEACLRALSPTECPQAAAELVAALRAGRADARAIIGLGYLRWEDALPLLHALLQQGFYSLYVLEAIAAIDPAGLYQPLLLALLRQPLLRKAKPASYSPNWTQLIDLLVGVRVAFTLAQVGMAVAAAIWQLLAYPDYLVRYHALDTLRCLFGMRTPTQSGNADQRDNLSHDALFDLIRQDNQPRAYRQAQEQFLAQLPATTQAALRYCAAGGS